MNKSVSLFPVIANIWSGRQQGVVWSKVGPYKIFATDLQNLASGREFESGVNA